MEHSLEPDDSSVEGEGEELLFTEENLKKENGGSYDAPKGENQIITFEGLRLEKCETCEGERNYSEGNVVVGAKSEGVIITGAEESEATASGVDHETESEPRVEERGGPEEGISFGDL